MRKRDPSSRRYGVSIVALALAATGPRITRATEEPPRAPTAIEQRRGTGLYIAAGVVGGLGVLARIGVGATALAYIGEDPDVHESDPQTSVVMEYIAAPATLPFVMTGLGLLSGGAASHGDWQARRDLATGAVDGRRARRWAAIGWSLFGSGVALWGATRVAGRYGCASLPCEVLVLELGYYPAMAMAAAGLVLGPYGSSYASTVRRRRLDRVSLGPMLDRGAFGIAVSGRF